MELKTEQESFWKGEFGNSYIHRNDGDLFLASNLNFFSRALSYSKNLRSCIEFGANIGMNLRALRLLFPNMDLNAIEINDKAVRKLIETIDSEKVYHGSILDYPVQKKFDLVFVKGVLIHINPQDLCNVYKKLFLSSNRYILIAEYFNAFPVSIPYRGHENKLFKRDFAGEMLDMYSQLSLIDYGFAYRRDTNFPQDDISWFLLEKKEGVSLHS